MTRVLTIIGRSFVADLHVGEDERVTDAGHVINYMKGWQLRTVKYFCRERHWRLVEGRI